MLAALLMGLQVVGPPAPASEGPRPSRPCPTEPDPSGDVVVCGRADQERFRLRPLPGRADDPATPRAEIGVLGDLKAAAETEQGNVGGFPSNRIMLRLKLPF